MTGRFSNFNSISYTVDRHKVQVTGTKCRLPDTMSGTGEIFIPGAVRTLSDKPRVQNDMAGNSYQILKLLENTLKFLDM